MLGRRQFSVWKLFVALGVPRRGVAQANTTSAPLRTHHKRTAFVGSESDRAYMLGFASGDLTAWQVSGTSVMVTSTTTHPAFVELFHQMFDGHGPVYQYPMYEEGKGYRWKVATRLDNSFRFLLTSRMQGLEWATDGGLVTHWLAGFTDSDGSIQISRAYNGVRMKLNLYNTNLELLVRLKNQIERLGLFPSGPYVTMPKGSSTPYGTYTKDLWNLPLQRTWEAQKLLRNLPVRHRERQELKRIIISISKGARWKDIAPVVREARRKVEEEVEDFAKVAENEYTSRHPEASLLPRKDGQRAASKKR